MFKRNHLKRPLLFLIGLSLLVFAQGTKALEGYSYFGGGIVGGLPDHWSVVPLDAGDRGGVEPNANNIIFFSHPSISYSTKNFGANPTRIIYGDTPETALQELNVSDLLGAPGFPDTSPQHWERENMRAMLADPAGLCYEPILSEIPNCSPPVLTALSGDDHYNLLSWQQLIADLRNTLSGEGVDGLGPEVEGVTLAGSPAMEPYDHFGLGSFIGNLSILGLNRESPEAICYDIVKIPGGIACPVFGKIFVRGHTPQTERQVVEFQSPILIYRQQSEDHPYHLVGYLANPTPLDYELFDDPDSPAPRYMQQHLFPVAIASLSSFPSSRGSLVVMNTATQKFSLCRQFNKQLELNQQEPFPWGQDCTYGVLWERTNPVWSSPLGTFDITHTLLAAPKIYDLAVGIDVQREVLFAPSNAPATEPGQEGKFYVLKYFENPSQVIDLATSRTIAAWLKLAAPRFIEVTPPEEGGNLGPFKIAVSDINQDGYSDFALTWKSVEVHSTVTEPRVWTSHYSPFFTIHLSDKNEAGEIIYHQSNIRVPEERAEIAAIAFGRYQGQTYIVAGDNTRQRTAEGDYHASVHIFPAGGGIVDTVNVKTVQVSFKSAERIDTPGVADLATDPSSGAISAALRNPFFPAPETCEAPSHGVYGYSWLGETRTSRGVLNLLDFDHDGIPNRCECKNADGDIITPDETNDIDQDELAKVRGCDDCAEHFNIDLETNSDGAVVGDGKADAVGCDNCPPSRCASRPVEGMSCINSDQADDDDDGMGNTCDACPETTDLRNGGVYGWGTPDDFGIFSLIRSNPTCPFCPFCTHCANAFVRPDGTVSSMDSLYGEGCSESIVTPGTAEANDIDGDGVPDARDNCVKLINPPRTRPVGTGTSVPSGQDDWDQDGSGDACDPENLGGCGRWDDCDNDGVPNRFDPTPVPSAVLQLPDSVYDLQAGVIARGDDLKPAQLNQLQNMEEQLRRNADDLENNIRVGGEAGSSQQRCGFPEQTWPGPSDCVHMGKSGREVNVLLPTPSRRSIPPYQCIPGGHDPRDRECTPEIPPEGPRPAQSGVSRFCIAKVGRESPKTAALFPEEQAKIISANNRIQEITGIKDFDIFVGAEGAVVHYECVLAGGAYPSVARATNVLPNVSGNVAPFLLGQLSGLPPIPYGRRPDPLLEIKAPKALLLAPISGEEGLAPLLPDASVAAGHREWRRIAAEGIQVGELRENINGSMIFKVLHAGFDIASEGTSLGVSDMQSLIVIDFKSYPEPSTEKPIEQRAYNVEYLITQLQKRVEEWKERGLPITTEIYRELPWETAMRPEFVIAQGTVPEAVASINQSLGVSASVARVLDIGAGQVGEGIPEGYTHQMVLPLYIKPGTVEMSGGGCGCHVQSSSISLLGFLIYLFCLLAPVPVFLYYRRSLSLRARRAKQSNWGNWIPRYRSGLLKNAKLFCVFKQLFLGFCR